MSDETTVETRNCSGCEQDTPHRYLGPSQHAAGWLELVCETCGSVDDYPPREPGVELALPGGARLSPRGLDLRSATELRFEEYEQIGFVLGRLRDALAFGLGDWIIFGEKTYGEKMAQAVEATGRSKATLQNYVWVARSIPYTRRRLPRLTWSHHRMVAKLDPAEQERWFDEAERDGLTVEEFGALLRPTPPIEPVPLPGDSPRGELEPSRLPRNGDAPAVPNGVPWIAPTLPDVTVGSAVAGVDFDTFKITVAILDLDGMVADVQTVRIRRDSQGGDAEAYEAAKRVPAALAEIDWSRVGVAFVEHGHGVARGNDWKLGRVQGAIAASLAARVRTREMELSTWRKRLTGKTTARGSDQEALTLLAREALARAGILVRRCSPVSAGEPVSPTYSMLSKDDLDAVSIAWVGRELVRGLTPVPA